jgi:hypothetical protein
MREFTVGNIDDLNSQMPEESYLLVKNGTIMDSDADDEFDYW